MKKVLLAAVLAVSLSGCLLEVATTGLIVGTTMYCAGVSEAGKQAARDIFTAGTKVLACEEPDDE